MRTLTTPTPATPSVQEAGPAQVNAWLDEGKAALIDVREPDERAGVRIAASTLMPLSRFDAASLPRAERVVFHCVSGVRAKEAAGRAAASGWPGVTFMAGGIKAWEAAGLPVVRTAKAPISIMRQVQVTVGTVVLVFSILAVAVSAWFALGAAFMGAGLVFAGSTGTCAMAAMLAKMPWNAGICGRGGCPESSSTN